MGSVDWHEAWLGEHKARVAHQREVDRLNITADDIDAYLSSLHCSAWGWQGMIHEQKGRDAAADFVLKTLAGVRAHKLEGQDGGTEEPEARPEGTAVEAAASQRT